MDISLQKQILRGLWVALLVAGGAAAIYYVVPLVYPFLFGWLIAYLMNPLVNLLQRRGRMPRWVAVTVSLLTFLSVTGAILAVLVTNIVYEISGLADYIQNNMESWMQTFIDFINSDALQSLIERISTFYNENPKYQGTINDNLSSTGIRLADAGSALIGALLGSVISFITSLPNVATVSIVALLAAFFISKDWYRIKDWAAGLLPEGPMRTMRTIWTDLQKALFGYLRAQFILISITAIVVIIGLLILRVPYAISIGLLTGFVDLLPYLGTGAVMVPWIVIVFIRGNVYLGVGLSILYGVILVSRQILEPKVLATSVGLDPLATLIAMFVGLKLLGFVGLIVGPVSLVLLSAFHRAHVFRDIKRYVLQGSASKQTADA